MLNPPLHIVRKCVVRVALWMLVVGTFEWCTLLLTCILVAIYHYIYLQAATSAIKLKAGKLILHLHVFF